jgi:hypothetical protein
MFPTGGGGRLRRETVAFEECILVLEVGTRGFAAVAMQTTGPGRVIGGSVSAFYCTSVT